MPDRQLFGTDGIRGVAGQYPLDEATVYAAGRALGLCLKGESAARGLPALLGEDPRESSRWIAETFAGGLLEEGIRPRSAGVITTPGIAYLTRSQQFAAGVMISASHNPYSDNGIKVFAHSGYKLPDEQEHKVEQGIFRLAGGEARRARLEAEDSLRRDYLDFLAALLPKGMSLGGMKMVLDCAHGSASRLAPELFERLGARVHVLHAEPDGRNINRDCGSLYPAALQARVPEAGADLGVAFDGDGDRTMLVTASGRLVDGDGVLLLAARHLKPKGRLKNDLVVATIMSNLGLEHALAREGVRMIRAPVGDKYVLEEMLRSGATLGGEQSGHVIFLGDHTTGDGLLTAVRVAGIMVERGRPLAELLEGLAVYPQVIRNVRVREKPPLEGLFEVSAAIRAAEERLGNSGRVIVRYSGTEPLARIMVEGEDPLAVEEQASAIAESFQRALGVR